MNLKKIILLPQKIKVSCQNFTDLVQFMIFLLQYSEAHKPVKKNTTCKHNQEC